MAKPGTKVPTASMLRSVPPSVDSLDFVPLRRLLLGQAVATLILNLSPQYIGFLPHTHRLHNLAVKQPCSTIIYAQLSYQGE
jgi:hypothetical protein